jgi:phosphoenolpyruvate carboxylase
VEIVLTAHPTQVNRRTLSYKHSKIAAMLQHNDRWAPWALLAG